MSVEHAWNSYCEDCEQVRQLFLRDPMVGKYPRLAANAHFILQQTQAMAYNLVMAPRQDSPHFIRGHFFEPLLYTAHQPNPDFVYQTAFLNGARRWRITGQRNSAHWTEIQVSRGWWGEAGYDSIGNYELDDFVARSDGSFEVLAGPDPSPGNWIRLDAASGNNVLLVRTAMYDWDRETPPEFFIQPIDDGPNGPAILEEAEVIRRLKLCAEFIKHCIGRWTTRGSPALLEKAGWHHFVTRRGEPSRGGANPFAQYGQAVYELSGDEALIIETENPGAVYWGISLGNWWWETIDPTHYKTSINGHQAVIDADGRFRAVLAHRDPGVANWLDPAGWNAGVILLRWYRAQTEQKVMSRKVPFAEVRRHLPADTAAISSAQRQEEIVRRGRAVMRWYGYEPPSLSRTNLGVGWSVID